MTKATRFEFDSQGEVALPADAYYGANTYRALQNFPLSGRPITVHPDFVQSLAIIKQAAARANAEIGALPLDKAKAIFSACQEVRQGLHDRHLVVDMLEGSGGTSTNMNVNEVVANVVAIRQGNAPGDYGFLHPNDHVNMGQSTNDVIPTAMKMAAHRALGPMLRALGELERAFASKQAQFQDVLRLGRTCLQDAQPMTLGQAMGGHSAVIGRHLGQLNGLREQFLHVPLAGTAIGTGFGSAPGYRTAVMRHLCELMGEALNQTADPFDGMQNMDTCARLSAELRNTANSLWKIANDLIILSSGPAGGIGEIALPSVQSGSSIMPGKVNPVIPMAVCQAAFSITGNDAAIALACQQGLLEINHYEMLVCDRLLDSISLLTRASDIFTTRCVTGLLANEDISLAHLMASSALATALVPSLGYATVSKIVREALAQNRSFVDVGAEQGLFDRDDVMRILRQAATVQQ